MITSWRRTALDTRFSARFCAGATRCGGLDARPLPAAVPLRQGRRMDIWPLDSTALLHNGFNLTLQQAPDDEARVQASDLSRNNDVKRAAIAFLKTRTPVFERR